MRLKKITCEDCKKEMLTTVTRKICVACNYKRMNQRSKEWYHKNKEIIKEKRKAYRLGVREKTLQYNKIYYEKNKQELQKYGREYYWKHKKVEGE